MQAVVTGGASGIGRAVVERLLEAEYQVLSLDLDSDRTRGLKSDLAEHSTALSVAEVDVIDRSSVRAAFTALETIDLLVNVAGIFWPKPFDELTEVDFRDMFEVHVVGTFIVSQEAVGLMKRGGRIVNMTSRTYIGSANFAHYVAAKSAVVGLTRAMAMDLAPKKISVNAVAPGLVDTSMPRALPRELLKKLIAAEPAGALTDPKIIADTVEFVGRPGSYLNGQVIVVDGGKSLGGTGF